MCAAVICLNSRSWANTLLMKSKQIQLATSSKFATKLEKKKGIDRKPTLKIDTTAISIAAKGFLRPHKSYTPPENIDEILSEALAKHKISNDLGAEKYPFLMDLSERLNHAVPNSELHTMNTASDVKAFYKNKISTETPWDTLVNMDDLPENLHLQKEFKKWTPDFAITAFPESKTLVTGLKYRNKTS